MPVLSTEKTKCYHCGNDCEEEIIVLADKNFCCFGCKSVFSLLEANNLCDYYDIENNPGVEIQKFDSNKYDYLENEELLSEILDFQNEKYATVTLYIPQIHCYSCLWLLEMFNQLHVGINKAKVNYLKKELSISYLKSETTLKDIALKLASIGYTPLIEKKNGKQTQGTRTNKKILYQLGIAGFCFGNTMFLSFPEYISVKGSIDPEILNYFGYVNLFLGSVVMIFSAKSFLLSAFQSLKHKKINLDVPISLGIASLFIYSAYEILLQAGTGYFDSLAGLVFFLLLGRWFQSKTFEQFNFERDYKSYFPLSVTKIAENESKIIPLNELKIGDIIQVCNEEILPADGVLLSETALIDYSFVTGESYPERLEARQEIFAGGRIKGSLVEMMVSKVPSQSYLTKLWNQSSEQKDTTISILSNKVGTIFTFVVLALAFSAAGYWYVFDSSKVLKVFTSILIVACPCALALAIPITYGNTLRILGNKKFYLKHANLIESLAKINHLVFDKTGTLTEPEKGKVSMQGHLSDQQKIWVYNLLQQSTHPLAQTLSNYLGKQEKTLAVNFTEYRGKGVEALFEGSLVQIGSKKWLKNSSETSLKTEVYVFLNGAELTCFSIQNFYRKGLQELFSRLKQNFQLSILSGDNDAEKQNLEQLSPNLSMYFNQSPHDKKTYIEKTQTENHTLLMIGDGLNDAGALMAATVGVAVTENSANFTPASDAIIEASEIKNLPQFLAFAKASLWIVYACFGLSFLYNFVGLFFAVQGKLSPLVSAILMPISSVSVLLLSLGLGWGFGRRIFKKTNKNHFSN